MDGLSGKGSGAPLEPRPTPSPAPDADRLCHVLQRMLTSIFEGEVCFASQLFLHRIGDADTSWFRQRLKPRRDVDAIAKQVAILHDNVPEVDANAQH